MRIILVRHGEPRRGTGEKSLEDYGLTDLGSWFVSIFCSKV